MQIFVDTAELDEIKKANSWGILDGVTTNPSLIKKAVQKRENIDMENYIKQICNAVDGPVSLEVIGLTREDMITQGELLYEKFNPVNDNVIVKIPINTNSPKNSPGKYEGLKTLKDLSSKGIPTNTTLIMKPEQALLAAKAGTQYVSPFAGRIDDFIRNKIGLTRGEDFSKTAYHDADWLRQASYLRLKPRYNELEGESLSKIYSDEKVDEIKASISDEGVFTGSSAVASIKQVFENYEFDTDVLAASLRNSRQVREVAEAGADVATIPFQVLEEMIAHYKTEKGVVSFSEDVVKEYEEIFS